jgi:hypothetical protein
VPEFRHVQLEDFVRGIAADLLVFGAKLKAECLQRFGVGLDLGVAVGPLEELLVVLPLVASRLADPLRVYLMFPRRRLPGSSAGPEFRNFGEQVLRRVLVFGFLRRGRRGTLAVLLDERDHVIDAHPVHVGNRLPGQFEIPADVEELLGQGGLVARCRGHGRRWGSRWKGSIPGVDSSRIVYT